MDNTTWMRQAVALSVHARLISPPNPWVGCVIVKEDKVVGKGFTQHPGGPHAEVMALQEAQSEAQSSTLFVTLEPCSHWGRTPPCVEAIIRAGVKKVVIGLEDPDPQVKGRGIKRLLDAGIEVMTHVCAQAIKKSLEPYLYHRQYGFPFCVLKSAMSIDGKIAAEDLSSQWITDIKAREDVHAIRAHSQAIMVGSTTAAVDHPRLTVRHPKYSPYLTPLRVICDTHGKLEPKGPLFDVRQAPTLIFTTSNCPLNKQQAWQDQGVEVIQVAQSEKGVDLREVLKTLGSRGVLQLLVEGGAVLQSEIIRQRLAQKWVIYTGNCLLGNTGIPLLPSLQISSLSLAPRLTLESSKKLGSTCRCIYRF